MYVEQGVVTYMYMYIHVPAVLTPAIGIGVRSSSQAVKLEAIKMSICAAQIKVKMGSVL